MKIAFVVPRFEPQLAGGAEVHCKRMAEKAAENGYSVDVLTTCARDHFSWKNYYEAGNIALGKLTVRRFPADPNRVTAGFLMLQGKIDRRMHLTEKEELQWISDSVRSRAMEEFMHGNRDKYDWFIFMPYLFGTTYWGIETVPDRSLLIPCLHDEPFAYLGIFKKMFNRVQGVMFNTYPEIELAKRLYSVPEGKITMVSLGFEAEKGISADRFREKYGICAPFILFAGRREGGKNTGLLLDYFRIYKKHNAGGMKLVLIGSGEVKLSGSDADYIIDLGYIPKADKAGAFAAASVFCQPSVNESLSIVVMEAWLSGRPVIVNAGCAVTKDHCTRSGGGLYFRDYPEFEECINYLCARPDIADKLGRNGKNYVSSGYNWDAVMERFTSALKRFYENRPAFTGIHKR